MFLLSFGIVRLVLVFVFFLLCYVRVISVIFDVPEVFSTWYIVSAISSSSLW